MDKAQYVFEKVAISTELIDKAVKSVVHKTIGLEEVARKHDFGLKEQGIDIRNMLNLRRAHLDNAVWDNVRHKEQLSREAFLQNKPELAISLNKEHDNLADYAIANDMYNHSINRLPNGNGFSSNPNVLASDMKRALGVDPEIQYPNGGGFNRALTRDYKQARDKHVELLDNYSKDRSANDALQDLERQGIGNRNYSLLEKIKGVPGKERVLHDDYADNYGKARSALLHSDSDYHEMIDAINRKYVGYK